MRPSQNAFAHAFAHAFNRTLHIQRAATLALLSGLLAAGTAARGAELSVAVSGLNSSAGTLGCALFAAAAAADFPLEIKSALAQRSPAKQGSMVCVFSDLAPGRYAVAVSHDLNDNGKADRNLIGMPTEPWAVSNNVRPSLRAPRFDEAAVDLAAQDRKQIELRLGQ